MGHSPHTSILPIRSVGERPGDVGRLAGGEIGIDVERVRSLTWGRLASCHFTPRKIATLRALVRPERQRGFFRLWPCKEAFLKAMGVGLAAPLSSVDVE